MERAEGIAATTNPERRAEPRREAVDRWARLAWRGDGRPTTKLPARLLDISGRGACVIAQDLPPPGQPVWLGLESLMGEWVRVVIRAFEAEGGRWTLHLVFGEQCPAGLLERATSGDPEGLLVPGESHRPFRLAFEWFPP